MTATARDRVVGPAPGDAPGGGPIAQGIAQRGFFAAPVDRIPDVLYAVVEGDVDTDRTRAVLRGRARVSQNTFFGRFPASYWQRWTAVTATTVSLRCRGDGTVRVVACDENGSPRTVTVRAVSTADTVPLELTAPIDRFVDGGAIWLEFESRADVLEISDVRWTVGPARTVRPTSIVVCTHDRADDCLGLLDVLSRDDGVRHGVTTVYVVDQGSEPVSSRAGFGPVVERFGGALVHLRQPNLGGAGGFTRGLCEAVDARSDGPVNALFMDDDIVPEPDVVVRLSAFADRAAEPVIVGAQMLHLLHPTTLRVGAETARFTSIEPGLAVPNALRLADVTAEHQNRRVDADYNAWWTCLIPSEIVDDIGYPMPFFFQWDDVEFGYRARSRGHATVTLPGAAIWHHDFDWKDEDDWARYFTLRNALVVDALHGDFRAVASARAAGRWIAECLTSMRYGEAETLLLAVEDFLRGADTLHDGGTASLARVREARAGHRETVRHPAAAVPGVGLGGRPVEHAGWTPSRTTAVMVKRLAWQWRGRTGGTVSISAEDASWWHVSRYRTAVVTDRSQEGVRIREYDRARLLALSRRTARVMTRLWREGDAVATRLRSEQPGLTSRASWRRRFGLPPAPVAAAPVPEEET